MKLGSCEKSMIFQQDNYVQYKINNMAASFDKAVGGYTLTYFRFSDGLLAGSQGFTDKSSATSALLLEKYLNSPTFASERIQIFVTDEGVQMFDWKHMAVQVRTVAENTTLASFAEIKQRFIDQVGFYNDPSATFDFEVTDVQLRLVYITAQNAPTNVWLVPVWEFHYGGTWTDPGSGDTYQSWDLTHQFSAIDGSYIVGALGR